MIVCLDSSVLARVYLSDEAGHDEDVALLKDRDVGLITGSWSRLEVCGALVRAARAGRGDENDLLALLDTDLAIDGPVMLVTAAADKVEARALGLIREHAIRTMDAWHLATASLLLANLAEPGEEIAFGTRDQARATVAAVLRLKLV